MPSRSVSCCYPSALVRLAVHHAIFVHTVVTHPHCAGSLVGSVLGGRYSDHVFRKLKARNGGTSQPEVRLSLPLFHSISTQYRRRRLRLRSLGPRIPWYLPFCTDAPREHDDLHALPPGLRDRIWLGMRAPRKRRGYLRHALPERPLLDVSPTSKCQRAAHPRAVTFSLTS